MLGRVLGAGLARDAMGLHSVTVLALCLVILFSALLGSRRSAFIYMFLSMLTLAVVLIGEHLGYVDNGLPRTSTNVELLNLYTSLVFLTIALMALMQHIELDRDAARESEEQYRLLADNVYDFIWTTDIELT